MGSPLVYGLRPKEIQSGGHSHTMRGQCITGSGRTTPLHKGQGCSLHTS